MVSPCGISIEAQHAVESQNSGHARILIQATHYRSYRPQSGRLCGISGLRGTSARGNNYYHCTTSSACLVIDIRNHSQHEEFHEVVQYEIWRTEGLEHQDKRSR